MAVDSQSCCHRQIYIQTISLENILRKWYTPISHNIMTTCLILYRSPLRPKPPRPVKAFYSARPLKACCGIWHQDISSRSFNSCKLRCWDSTDRTCFSELHRGPFWCPRAHCRRFRTLFQQFNLTVARLLDRTTLASRISEPGPGLPLFLTSSLL